jgi:hypothetical protein
MRGDAFHMVLVALFPSGSGIITQCKGEGSVFNMLNARREESVRLLQY